jgi:hypothetical protein
MRATALLAALVLASTALAAGQVNRRGVGKGGERKGEPWGKTHARACLNSFRPFAGDRWGREGQEWLPAWVPARARRVVRGLVLLPGSSYDCAGAVGLATASPRPLEGARSSACRGGGFLLLCVLKGPLACVWPGPPA